MTRYGRHNHNHDHDDGGARWNERRRNTIGYSPTMKHKHWKIRWFSYLLFFAPVATGFAAAPKSHVLLSPVTTRSTLWLQQNNFVHATDRSAGFAVLFSVPLAWGTYSPVVKYLYETMSLPGLVFSAAYYAVASAALTSLAVVSKNDKVDQANSDHEIPFHLSPILAGGLELGGYLFLANALQVRGLETVPSDRAGFLVQLTTVLVPLLQAATSGVPVSPSSWLACLVALTGVLVLGLDQQPTDNTTSLTESIYAVSLQSGDGLILAAAFLYSLHVVRLGTYARQTMPLQLAAAKATTETVLSVVAVITLGLGGGDAAIGQFLHEVSMASIPPAAIGAILWTGLVTCAYTIFAQSYGQARVSPTEANLIYSTQPLYTALFGYILLGETLGPTGVVGAALIASAVLYTALFDTNGQLKNNQQDVN